MSTQTLYQGSHRPTRTPAITVVHPGLQVHSIAAPKTDRRLSFLMSANLYCAFAAGVVLVAQASPDLRQPRITADRNPIVVELQPPDVRPRDVPSIAPTPSSHVPSSASPPRSVTEPQPVPDTPATPASIGSTDLSGRSATGSPSTPGNGTADSAADGPRSGTFSTGPATGQPVEVNASAVRVLQQIQPSYPDLARLAHKEGDVVLLMTINEQGYPIEVKMDSGEAIFRNSAIHAAQQWRFTPASFNGQPHTARFRLTLQFRLRG